MLRPVDLTKGSLNAGDKVQNWEEDGIGRLNDFPPIAFQFTHWLASGDSVETRALDGVTELTRCHVRNARFE